MNLMPSLVSVLMTAYNREKYIAEAVESVLASTYKNFELIIVDDCSADNTVAIAKSYESRDERVKVYINEKNLGDYPNRNKAASFANGKFIKYLDSDDIIYPYGLEVMVTSMEKFPQAGYGLSASGYEEEPMPVLKMPEEAYREHFESKNHFDRAPGSAIIRKDAFDAVGGFSGKRMIGDFELWLKMSCRYPLVVFQRDLVWDRMHTDQERQSDYAKKYEQLRNEVLEIALSSINFPLSNKELQQIKKRLKKKQVMNYVRRLL